MKASHKKTTVLVGLQEVKLEPGQFVFGRNKASEETGLSVQNVRTYLKNLKNSKNLTIKTTNKYSIVSIVNWDSYQQIEFESNQQSNKQLTSNQPAANHIQEHKELKNNIYTSNFEKFWSAYPRRVGKGAAFKAYQKIKEPKPGLIQIIESISKHKNSKQWQDSDFIPHPATFLNQRRWEDDPEPLNGTSHPSVSKTREEALRKVGAL